MIVSSFAPINFPLFCTLSWSGLSLVRPSPHHVTSRYFVASYVARLTVEWSGTRTYRPFRCSLRQVVYFRRYLKCSPFSCCHLLLIRFSCQTSITDHRSHTIQHDPTRSEPNHAWYLFYRICRRMEKRTN